MNVYISSENNNIFLYQRKRIIKKFLLNNDGTEKIFLFTEDLYSLKILNRKIKRNCPKTLYIIDKVINQDHFKEYLKKNKIYFNYIFFVKKIILILKLIYFYKNFRTIFLDVKLVYIFIDEKDKKINITGNKNFIIFFSEPFLHANKVKLQNLHNKKIHGVYETYFDSAFPLHPDLVGIRKRLKFSEFNKKFVLEYLNYLNRIFVSKKKVLIFLPPRTYNSIVRNKKFKNFILKFSPQRFYFLNGIDSFLSLKKNNKKIFTQKGGQINFFKQKKFLHLKIIYFDKKFKLNLLNLKNNKLDQDEENFINNYFSIFFECFKSRS